MSEQQKIYAPVQAKAFEFRDGGSILKVSFKAEAMVNWINANKNAKGYVNLGISKRKTVGQYGDTHTVWLDTWEPKASENRPAPAPKQPTAPAPIDDLDVPF